VSKTLRGTRDTAQMRPIIPNIPDTIRINVKLMVEVVEPLKLYRVLLKTSIKWPKGTLYTYIYI